MFHIGVGVAEDLCCQFLFGLSERDGKMRLRLLNLADSFNGDVSALGRITQRSRSRMFHSPAQKSATRKIKLDRREINHKTQFFGIAARIRPEFRRIANGEFFYDSLIAQEN